MAFPETEHPQEAFPGFTERLTLSSGVVVLLRRVDVEAITLDTAAHVLNSFALLEQGAQHAKDVVAEVVSRDPYAMRPPSFEQFAAQAETVLEVSQRTIKAALLTPRLEALVAMYGGREDMSEPDLGLGNDYSLLLSKIDSMNPTEVAAQQAAGRFPAKLGGNSRQRSKAVRNPAK